MAAQGDVESLYRLENAPQPPPLAAHLWGHFLDLHQTRANNGMSICRLTRHDIRAWEADEGVSLDRWERRAILAIDAAFVAVQLAKQDA